MYGHEHRLVLAACDETYPEQHGLWHCDGCGRSGKGASQMFHCPLCGDYDLCSACAFENKRPPTLRAEDDDDEDASISEEEEDETSEEEEKGKKTRHHAARLKASTKTE